MRLPPLKHSGGRCLRIARAFAFLLPLLAAPALALPPRYHFSTLDLGRVRIHFHAEAEAPARRAGALVLEILPELEKAYGVRLPGLDVVVHDASDAPNGSALSFPYPLVEIRTASFDGADVGPVDSWLRLVITHELTHAVHLEQARGLYGAFRHVFGRAPFLFPDALQPAWFIEGLAVREETRGTAFGRGRHTLTRLVVDEAARAGQLDHLGQATLGLDVWPQGQAPYLFGSEFLAWLDKRNGGDAARAVARSHAGALRPYLDSRSFRDVTGQRLPDLWRAFAAERRAALAPPSPVESLTHRGGVQTTPRVSPDGRRVAYVSRRLDRAGEIRVMNLDGSEDERLCERLSGSGLAWARDGDSLVYDEVDVVRRFESRSDLYRVDLKSGRVKRLTRGLRASDPDEGPRPSTGGEPPLVFVRRLADRAELALLGERGTGRTLTRSDAGTEWSRPRFSPSGRWIAAARMAQGFLDLVLVDPESGEIREITHDRALDAEPSWIDENTLVFRSDREDDAFRLFFVDVPTGRIRRVSGPPGAAFSPDASPRGGGVVFAHYSARGYDIARARADAGAPAEEFRDAFPEVRPEPAPVETPSRPYSVWPALAPRFFTPFIDPASDEWHLGAATASVDALSRVTWGLALSRGLDTGVSEALGYLSYERFTPSFTLVARRDVLSTPFAATGEATAREARLSIEYPVERSVRRRQTAGLTFRLRRELVPGRPVDEAVAAATWDLDSTRQYPLAISPVDGSRFRAAYSRSSPTLGADLSYAKVSLSFASYRRLGNTVLAARLGGAAVFGAQASRAAFEVGGLSKPAFLDPAGDDPAVLRGYADRKAGDTSRLGTRLAFGNLEWRLPLGFPQRGYRAFPFFVRHLHASLSVDAAALSTPRLDLRHPRVGVSLGLGANLLLGHRFPVTITGGVGRGLTRDGSTVPWVSLGFPF